MFVVTRDVKVHHQRNTSGYVSGSESRRWAEHKAYWRSFTNSNEKENQKAGEMFVYQSKTAGEIRKSGVPCKIF
jgi:hypothetical protein